MVQRFSALVLTVALAMAMAMAMLMPNWSAAQVTPGDGAPNDVPAKTGAAAATANAAAPTAAAGNIGQGCCGIPWIGPATLGCPASRHDSGFCDTWRGGFIGLKYRCCFRYRYGYPYYGPSYPLVAQSFPTGCCHPIIGTVYGSGCGVACGYWRGSAVGVPLPSGADIVATPQTASSAAPVNAPKVPPAKEAPSKNTAHLQLLVPENAEVRIDDHETSRTGTVRQFISPPLAPGKNFTYKITVRYRDDNGATVEAKRSIRVHANERYRMDFSRPETIPVSAEH